MKFGTLTGRAVLALVAGLLMAVPAAVRAQAGADAGDPGQAWADLQRYKQPPSPPIAWETVRPTPDEVEKFRTEQRRVVLLGADKAHEFVTRYPTNKYTEEAQKLELRLLTYAMGMGIKDAVPRVDALEREMAKRPGLSEDERFGLLTRIMMRSAGSIKDGDRATFLNEFAKNAQTMQRDFPKRSEPYEWLLRTSIDLVSDKEYDKAVPLLKTIVDNESPDVLKSRAKGILKRINARGKPFELQFNAIDGRDVSIASLRGKVVLIEFWATWCGPCTASFPAIKSIYEKYHAQGFDIVGINLDAERKTVGNFVAKEKVLWPHYFDGKLWENRFAQEYGINALPARWLVDKKGVLRELSVSDNLEKQIEQLLAEE